MKRHLSPPLALLALACAWPCRAANEPAPATVLYRGQVREVADFEIRGEDLWVPAGELEHVTGFTLKPEGACLEEICVPVDRAPEANLLRKEGDAEWINLTGFARRLKQAVARDAETNTWSLSEIPLLRGETLGLGMAPDFELDDVNGRKVRLSDFRGKKVLIVTWASW